MPEFTGTYRDTFTVDAPIEKAKEHFFDRDAIIAAYPELERGEKIGDSTIHFVLAERSAMGASFRGEYTVEYTWASDDRLEWRDRGDGNMKVRGSIDFRPLAGDRTELRYEQTLVLDIPVNRFLAKAIAPIVSKSIQSGAADYVDQMKRSLARR